MLSRCVSAAVLGVVLLSSAPSRAAWPTLDEALRLAQKRATTVVSARGQVAVADASQGSARAPFLGNPYLDMQFDRGSTTKDVQAMGYLYLPVDIFGQRAARIDEANALVRWKNFSLQDTQALVAAETAYAYGSVLVAAERLELSKRGEQAAKGEVDYFAARLVAQDATIYERSLAETELARWVQLRAEANYGLSSALVRLSELTQETNLTAPQTSPPVATTGVGASANASAPLSVLATPAAIMPPDLRTNWDDAAVVQAVERSPSILSQKTEEDYWEMAKQRWEAERRAGISVLLIGGRGDPGDLRLGGGLAITFPFTRRNQTEIARAEAEKFRTMMVREAQTRNLTLRLQRTVRAYRDLRDALTSLDSTGIPAAQRALDAAQEGYRRGKIDLVHAFLARRELATMQGRRLELVQVAWRAYSELTVAKGALP